MNIKVLQLEPWMLNEFEPAWRDFITPMLGTERYPEMPPVFNRAGVYAHNGKCWIEVAGKAFSVDSMLMFNHRLKTLEAEKYTARQVAALKAVCTERLATKEQLELLQSIQHVIELKQTSRNTRKFILKYLKENRNVP